MGNRSQVDIDRTLSDIRKLKDANNTDNQIMDTLGIPLPTYRRYVARIHKQNEAAWLSLTRDGLETELLRLKGSLEHTYKIALRIAEDPNRLDQLDALQAKDDARLSIVHLLTEGPEMIKKVEGLLAPKRKERWIFSEKNKKKYLLHDDKLGGAFQDRKDRNNQLDSDRHSRFIDKAFYCWDTAFLGRRDCCFNHIIGLPQKDNKAKPLFDTYQYELYETWEHYQNIWIKKATGLGISEFFLRLMLWLCLRDDTYRGCQMCIVTGPNVDLAKKLIGRLQNLVKDQPELADVLQSESQYAVEVNRVWIQAYPSHNLGSYRSLTAPKFIFLDEADFFPSGQLEDVRHVAERYIAKSNPWIVMVSTPNKPGGLFEQIENEPDDTCLYKKIYLPYTVGLNKIYTVEEINKAKRSPSFEREYNLQYGYGLGNVFLPTEIDQACSRQYNPSKINHGCPISMGIDPGFGSSKFGFCVLMLEDDIIKVIYAKEFDRPKYEDMLNLAISLKGMYKPQKIYVDGAKPDFIKSLKVQVREPSEYDKVIAKAVHDKVDIEYRMKIVPINFNEYGKELLGRAQNVVSKGWLAVSPTEHKELVVQMRMARSKENGNLDKEETGNSTYDVFDAFRLALKMYNMPRV